MQAAVCVYVFISQSDRHEEGCTNLGRAGVGLERGRRQAAGRQTIKGERFGVAGRHHTLHSALLAEGYLFSPPHGCMDTKICILCMVHRALWF